MRVAVDGLCDLLLTEQGLQRLSAGKAAQGICFTHRIVLGRHQHSCIVQDPRLVTCPVGHLRGLGMRASAVTSEIAHNR